MGEMKQQMRSVISFMARRNRILIEMNTEKMIELAKEEGIPIPSTKEALLAGMHKARVQIITMPEVYKEESREWLKKHGFTEEIETPSEN